MPVELANGNAIGAIRFFCFLTSPDVGGLGAWVSGKGLANETDQGTSALDNLRLGVTLFDFSIQVEGLNNRLEK